MGKVNLTLESENDLIDIFLYGIEQFGFEQASQFQDELRSRFQEIAKYPYRFQAVNFIHQEYRRGVYHSHSIKYRIDESGISIARILKKQNISRAFPKHFKFNQIFGTL